jgi:hypothetical protein
MSCVRVPLMQLTEKRESVNENGDENGGRFVMLRTRQSLSSPAIVNRSGAAE